MPATSVYFVCPRRIAWTAASLMRSGVSKSGSPAPNEMTSTPCARSALALACTASVEDGASVFKRSASTVALLRRRPAPLLEGELLRQPLLDDRRHEARDRRAKAGDFLDEARGDVRVLLVRHEEHRLDGRPELPVHQRHLELVLEVRDGADTAHDAVGALARDQVDQEPVERDDAEVAEPGCRLVDHLEALLDREQRLLRGIRDDRDDQLVEDLEAALDDVDVAVVYGIEHARVDRTLGHGPQATLRLERKSRLSLRIDGPGTLSGRPLRTRPRAWSGAGRRRSRRAPRRRPPRAPRACGSRGRSRTAGRGRRSRTARRPRRAAGGRGRRRGAARGPGSGRRARRYSRRARRRRAPRARRRSRPGRPARAPRSRR